MLLYFPEPITSDDLFDVVGRACVQYLVANGIEEVSEIKVSMVGWRDGQQCYVADRNGTLAPIIFDRLLLDGGAPSSIWAPREANRVYTLPLPWAQLPERKGGEPGDER